LYEVFRFRHGRVHPVDAPGASGHRCVHEIARLTKNAGAHTSPSDRERTGPGVARRRDPRSGLPEFPAVRIRTNLALTSQAMHLTNILADAIELSEARLLQRLRSQGLMANVLVSSHGLRLEAIAAFLMKRLPMPVATTVLPGVLSFPDTSARTWLLWDVAQLSPAQ